MMYLTHIPFLIDGVPDLNGDAKAIRYGCYRCGETLEIPIENEQPSTWEPPEPIAGEDTRGYGDENDGLRENEP